MLEVRDLKIEFYDHTRPEVAVRDVDFTMNEGEIVGLVGESGSGKSLTATAIAGLIRRGDVKISGEVMWELSGKEGSAGRFSAEGGVAAEGKIAAEAGKEERIDLLKASRKQMRALQGKEIGFIFQDPMTAFSPVHKIGYQVEDALRVHGKTAEETGSGNENKEGKSADYSKEELRRCAIEALAAADLPDPERVYNSYPFELSGGMRQRAMIASAMISSPRLLIADEPTTALDVTVQAEIIKLLKRINEEKHTAILFISHDLGLVRKLCSKVLVLKNGDVVEQGAAGEIFNAPKADYTKKLIAAEVNFEELEAEEEAAEGAAEKGVAKAGTQGFVSDDGKAAVEGATESSAGAARETPQVECEVRNLTFLYPKRRNIGDTVIFAKKTKKESLPEKTERTADADQANAGIGIHDINLTIHKGEIVGLVGESGSGKSTLAKCIAGLNAVKKDASGEDQNVIRKNRVGMIFQDSYSALNPKRRVGWLLREVLKLQGVKDRAEQDDAIGGILKEVELSDELMTRFPAELSGGQRQRIMIAMALLQKPTLLIADEPVSALDVAIQESITKLLKRLSRERNVAILFISHDLRTVYMLCDKVCVMKEGRIIEEARRKELYSNPREEYTKLLLRSALE